jgi:uncharacterized protein YxjI
MDKINKILSGNQFIIKQHKEILEILSGFETKNKYIIMDENKSKLGYIAEQGSGLLRILKRFFLRSHRPFDITVFDNEANEALRLNRKFFWIFSDLFVQVNDKKIGSIHRRFSFYQKKYSIQDDNGLELFLIKSPIWRLWSFPITDKLNNKIGIITKKWQGLISEIFTDADAFLIKLDSPTLSDTEKVLLFASGISIDFDFFENNQGSSGLLDFLGN